MSTAPNAKGGASRMDFESETFVAHTLRGTGHDVSEDGASLTVWTAELMPTLSRQMGGPSSQDMEYHCSVVQRPMGVRRLTPREMERLQGFPDDYTAIPWRGKPVSECPDGPRAKALGNSMAVPVMRWIGERIAIVEKA